VTVLREAVKSTPASGNASLLGEAFNTLAGIGRFQGAAERMTGDREQQGSFLVSGHDQAKFIFEQSLDALALNGTQSVTASSLFSRSLQRAIQVGDKVLQHRSILYLCSLASSGRIGRHSSLRTGSEVAMVEKPSHSGTACASDPADVATGGGYAFLSIRPSRRPRWVVLGQPGRNIQGLYVHGVEALSHQ